MSMVQDRQTTARAEADARMTAEWVPAGQLGPLRRGETAAAALLPDGPVLYAVAGAAGRKDGQPHIAFCHLPDMAALARRRGRWTGRRGPLLLVLPADKVLVKDLTLPSESPQEVEQMLSHEVETLSPFGAERTQYSYVPLRSPHAGRTAIRCFLVDQAAVTEICEPFARASIPVRGLLPSALASVAGLQGLANMQPDQLYMVCQDGVAESVALREDGTVASRVGLLGADGQAGANLAREVLTSLSLFSQATGRVHVAGLPPQDVRVLAERASQMEPARPVDLRALECAALAPLPEALRVPAIRLAGALWLQRTEPQQVARACIVPPRYRKDLQRYGVIRQDLHWVGICLAVGLLGAAALAAGNSRMERLTRRIEREIVPHVGVASHVAAKREQLTVARRQLDNRDQPLRILTNLAEVTPNGVFFYKVSLAGDGTVVIDGVADSLHLAFEFPEYLRKSPLFTQIQLNYAQQSKAGEQSVVEFRCTCRAQRLIREGRP